MKPMIAMRATLRTAALAVAALALAACGDGVGGTPLQASIEQSRGAQVRGLVYVAFANPSSEDVAFDEVSLADDRFAPVPRTVRPVEVAAGTARLLVPVPIGAARCTGLLATPRVVTDGETVPIDDDGRALLDRLAGAACDRAALAEQASITYAPDAFGVMSPTAVSVLLRLERQAGDLPVTVDAVGSNVIFTASAPVPATLGPDDDLLDIEVVLDAQRCEPHALAESKKTFILPVWVGLGDGDPQYLELVVTGAAREALERAMHDGCTAA
jgi:hypothetical protein